MPSLKLSYSLTYKTNSLDISSICDSTQTEVTRNLCTQEFKSAIDTATIVIKCSRDQYTLRSDVISIIQDAMDSLEPVELKIQCNGLSIFKGYLDLSEVNFSSKKGPESITLSAEDISAKILDVSVDEYVILEDKHISEIIEYLVALAGGGNLYKNKILEKDDHVIPVFAIDKEDDNDTFRDYIDTLLFEAGGYVLDTDEEGRMSIIALPWESYEPARVVDNYLLEDGIETTRQIFNKTGLKLTWSTLAETPKEQTVWTADFSRTLSDGKLIGKEVAAGAYYPEDGDVTASYQEYSVDFLDREYNTNQSRTKNNDLSIIAVRDVSATIITTDADGNDLDNDAVWDYPVLPSLGMEVNPTLYAKKAWYLLRNKTDDAVNLQFFTLQGRVLYRSKINYLTIPSEAKSLEEYTSTYIFTNEHAKRFASFYWNFLKTSQTIHKWTEIGDATLGEVVLINHKESEFGQATLIVGATLSFVGNAAKVECIGVAVGAYNEYKMKEWASSATSKPNGPSGTAAPATQIMYKWGKYQDIPPIQDGVWFFAGRPIFYKGAIWGDLTGSAWTDLPTDRPDDLSYLWMRTSVDGGKTWTYACIQLPPIIDFTIFASDVTYNMSSRGVVLSSKTIKLTVVKQNTNADCTWHVTPESLIDGSESGSIVADSFEITIPEGFTETVVKITAQVGNLSEKSVQINGVLAGESEPMYLGEYPKDEEDKPTKSPYGDLIKGDYILYNSINSSGETEPIPMYWTGYEWRPVVEEVENYSQIMGSILGDILKSDASKTSIASMYGFFDNLASFLITVGKMIARNIIVQDYNASNPDAGMKVRILSSGEDDCPIFDVSFGGRIVFKIVPSTGRIFLGEPNETLDAPQNGFMYDPETECITSANNKIVIRADGALEVVDGDISGVANISRGFFGGQIDCPSFSSLPRSSTEEVMNISAGAENQYKELDAVDTFLTIDTKYSCTFSLDDKVKYFCYKNYGGGHRGYEFYESLTGNYVGRVYASTSWWVTSYYSTYADSAFTLTITYGVGDYFAFKDLPTESNGLKSGQVWRDGTTLKVVP